MKKNKASNKVKLFIALLTLINSAVLILTRIYDRKEIIRAVENNGEIKALTSKKSETKAL